MSLLLTLAACSLLGGAPNPKADAPSADDRDAMTLRTDLKSGCFSGEWTRNNHAKDEVFVDEGEAAFDFTLDDISGHPVHLADLLEQRPVLLVTGSYSCPIYRRNRKKIDRIASRYESELHVVLVHGPEAHPGNGDPSPYRGKPWPMKFSDRGLPQTHEQRIALAEEVGAHPSEILIVEPMDNPVWCSFGTVPNGAFLIAQDGTLAAVHAWFDNATMLDSIDALLP